MSLAILLVAIFIPLINADAETSGSFSVDVGDPSINIVCNEDWSGSTWGACVGDQQTFICFDKNNCGTEELKPAQCGQIRYCLYCGDGLCNDGETCSTCPTDCGACSSGGDNNGGSSGGGGSGGGGSSGGGSSSSNSNSNLESLSTGNEGCTESWVCDDWSKSKGECGSRTCVDTNECGTEELKPIESQKCSSLLGRITGDAVSEFIQSKTGRGVLIASLIVLVGLLIFVKHRKNSKDTNPK